MEALNNQKNQPQPPIDVVPTSTILGETPKKRNYLFWILAILTLAVILNLFVYIMFNFGIWNWDMDKNLGLTPLYSHTRFRHVNNLSDVVALFDNNTKALISDQISDNKYLILIDLNTDTTTKIKLNLQDFTIVTMLSANDKVFVLGYSKENVDKNTHVFLVDSKGGLTELEYINMVIYQIGDKLKYTLPSDLGSVTELSSRQLNDYKNPEVYLDGFFDNKYYIQMNNPDTPEKLILKSKTVKTIVNDFTSFNDNIFYKDLIIKVERNDFYPYAGITSNQNITKITISRLNKQIKEYSLKDLYYYTVLNQNKLYLFGESAKNVKLDDL